MIDFASCVGARRLLLFHHDPLHPDAFLDALHADARERWAARGGDPDAVTSAMEAAELGVEGASGEAVLVPTGAAPRAQARL